MRYSFFDRLSGRISRQRALRFALTGITAAALGGLFYTVTRGENTQHSPDRSESTDARAHSATAVGDSDFADLEAGALQIRFELRYAEIVANTRRQVQAQIARPGFAWLPARSLQSAIDIECLPRMQALRRRAADYSSEILAAAIPNELLSTKPVEQCERIVYETLCESRAALAPCDPRLLRTRLQSVDRLQFDFQKQRTARSGESTKSAPQQALSAFEEYVVRRKRLLGPFLNEELFAAQDDHTKLLYSYAAFRADPATRDLPVAQRLAYYRKLAGSFEEKHGVRLKDHDSESRDHAARLLDLLDGDATESPEHERERFELLKELRGPEAARRDRELRRESRAERTRLAAFETERKRMLAEIDERIRRQGGGERDRRSAVRTMEKRLSERFFAKH